MKLKYHFRPRQDSNLQSLDPKSSALSIRPHGRPVYDFLIFFYSQSNILRILHSPKFIFAEIIPSIAPSIQALMVQWKNACLPRTWSGFDSRSMQKKFIYLHLITKKHCHVVKYIVTWNVVHLIKSKAFNYLRNRWFFSFDIKKMNN